MKRCLKQGADNPFLTTNTPDLTLFIYELSVVS